jgi:hypothetical protein
LSTEAALNLELNEWYEREEVKWQQNPWDLWLREGDRNSKFFHLSTLVRRRRNFIVEVLLPNGQWIHSRDEIENYFVDQFNELFHSSQPQIPHELDDLFLVCISHKKMPKLLVFLIPKN